MARGLSSVSNTSLSNRGICSDLCDEVWHVVREQRGPKFAAWALQRYQKMTVPSCPGVDVDGRMTVPESTPRSVIDIYTAVMQCVITSGKYHLIGGILNDMGQRKVRSPLSFYESAMKQLAHVKQHQVALTVYDRLAADGLIPSAVTCSCLVSFAAEVGELDRAVKFFENLSSMMTPSIRAYMTIFRVHAKQQDWHASLATFRDMQRRGVMFDSPVLNIVLATGITANFEEVEQLLTEAEEYKPPILDLISYNTIAKGYAQRNDAKGAVGVIDRMRARGIAPNSITFNTAMDAAAGGPHTDIAWGLLEEMRQSGMRPDKFTCSVLVKVLSRSPRPDKIVSALSLLHEIDAAFDPTLRSSLYQAVGEAAFQAGDRALLLQVVTQMKQRDVPLTIPMYRILHASKATAGNAASQPPLRAKKF
jgi:pentatricopeptide repeat protein